MAHASTYPQLILTLTSKVKHASISKKMHCMNMIWIDIVSLKFVNSIIVSSIVIGQTIISFWHKKGKGSNIIASRKATTWNPNQYQSVSKCRPSDNYFLKNRKPKPKMEGGKRGIKYVNKWNNNGMSRNNEMSQLGHK